MRKIGPTGAKKAVFYLMDSINDKVIHRSGHSYFVPHRAYSSVYGIDFRLLPLFKILEHAGFMV